nr:hypothetical protein [Verrucosispora sp. ts21]
MAKHRGEPAPVESVVGGVREVAELVEGVPAAADGGIDVEEVAGGCPVVEGVHLAGHHVIGVQDRTDVHLDWRLGAPVRDQFHAVLLVWLGRFGDV